MPGIWDPSNKPKLPGFYNRFKLQAEQTIKNGKRGTLAMPIKSNWGPVKKFITVRNVSELSQYFGSDESFTAFKLGSLALLGGPKELLLYRITDGSEAQSILTLKDTTATPVSVIDIKSIYPTNRDFNITVRANITDGTKQDLLLFEGTKLICSFLALSSTVDGIVDQINKSDNGYIVATKKADGNNKLANITNTKLTGGNNGVTSITNANYISALSEFEKVKFNEFCLDGISEASLNETIKSWVSNIRDQGKKVVAYIGAEVSMTVSQIDAKSKALGHEGIIHVGDSGIKNGIKYTPAETACYIAGLAASCNLKDSLCNRTTAFEDVEPKRSKIETEDALNAGTLVFKLEEGEVLIVDDVNTLSASSEKGENLRYIRTVKFIDTVDEDTSFGGKSHIGKTPNNRNGQLSVLTAIKKYFEVFVQEEIIEADFTVEIDEALQANAKSNEFFWKWDADHIDVMKRIYGTGYIK